MMDKEQLQELARQSARASGIDPEIFVRQINRESRWNPQAVSKAGAQGIAQFMPATAKALGLEDPFDPEQALPVAARHMADMVEFFDGDMGLALAAYNAGQPAVAKYKGVPPYPETQAYVNAILADSARIQPKPSSVLNPKPAEPIEVPIHSGPFPPGRQSFLSRVRSFLTGLFKRRSRD